MNNEKTVDARLIGFTAVAALLGAGFAAAMTASADVGLGVGAERGRCDPEQHQAIEDAIESGDYTSWKNLMGDKGHISDVVTEENFATFAAMHEAMDNGDYEQAQTLREELGLGMRPGDGTGFRGGMRGGMMHRGAGSGDGINNRWGN